MIKKQSRYTRIVNTILEILPKITFIVTVVFWIYFTFALWQNLIFHNDVAIPFLYSGLNENLTNLFGEGNTVVIKLIEFSIRVFLFLLAVSAFFNTIKSTANFNSKNSLDKQVFPITSAASIIILSDLIYNFLLNK